MSPLNLFFDNGLVWAAHGTYILKRLAEAMVVCVGISVITFLLLHVAGDPVQLLLSIEAKAEDAAILRKSLGLDQPLYVQYGIFLKGLVQFDFGHSLFIREPALQLVLERFSATIELTLAGMVIAVLIAIPLGVVAAIRRYSLLDNICTMLAVSGQAMPIFWLGLMLIIFFSVQLHMLPASGRGTFVHLLMPAFTLGASLAPITMRMTRSKMLDIRLRTISGRLAPRGSTSRSSCSGTPSGMRLSPSSPSWGCSSGGCWAGPS